MRIPPENEHNIKNSTRDRQILSAKDDFNETIAGNLDENTAKHPGGAEHGAPEQRREAGPIQAEAHSRAQQLKQPQSPVAAQQQRGDERQRRGEAEERVRREGQSEARAQQPPKSGAEGVQRADGDARADHPQKEGSMKRRTKSKELPF